MGKLVRRVAMVIVIVAAALHGLGPVAPLGRLDETRAEAAPSAGTVRDGEVLVLARARARVDGIARRHGAVLGEEVAPRVRRVRVVRGEEFARAAALRREPEVEAAAPNFVRSAQVAPNDPLYAQQWAPDRIGAPSAWDVTRGVSTVKIAVLDSGVDPNHPDLAGKLLPGVNFLGVDPPSPGQPGACPATTDTRDDYGHGTHVSGVAAAGVDNGVGIVGIAWEPRILPVKVLDCVGNGTDAQVIAGIDWAVAQGARVINLSFGGPGQSDVLDAAIERAWRAGILVVAAAGNARTSEPFYPAGSPHALSITATDRADRFASSFSNYGAHVAIAAPGAQILSTYPTYMGAWHVQQGYQLKDGTSMATPHVAGLAALLWSLHPTHNVDRIAGILMASADRVEWCPFGLTECPYDLAGRNDYYGRGRINVARAVRFAQVGMVPIVMLRVPG